jgi:tRNA 2-thiouridine synthesizing protein A
LATATHVDRTLDVRGQYCPAPVIQARQAIDELQSGQVLQIIADDPASKEDISRWAKRTGHDLIDLTVDGKDITFVIRKA